MEGLHCVNDLTIGSKCTRSIGFYTLVLHADDALRDGVTGSIAARVGFGLEAIKIGLHCINSLAHWVSVLVDFTAIAVVSVYKVDATNATTGLT